MQMGAPCKLVILPTIVDNLLSGLTNKAFFTLCNTYFSKHYVLVSLCYIHSCIKITTEVTILNQVTIKQEFQYSRNLKQQYIKLTNTTAINDDILL